MANASMNDASDDASVDDPLSKIEVDPPTPPSSLPTGSPYGRSHKDWLPDISAEGNELSKPEAVDALAQSLEQPKFSFLDVIAIKRACHGSQDIYASQYQKLKEYNGEPITELSRERREEILDLILNYFEWTSDLNYDSLKQALLL